MEHNSSTGNQLELKPNVLRQQIRRAMRTKEQRRRRRNFLRAQTGMVSRRPKGD